jgi:hypothetical protein
MTLRGHWVWVLGLFRQCGSHWRAFSPVWLDSRKFDNYAQRVVCLLCGYSLPFVVRDQSTTGSFTKGGVEWAGLRYSAQLIYQPTRPFRTKDTKGASIEIAGCRNRTHPVADTAHSSCRRPLSPLEKRWVERAEGGGGSGGRPDRPRFSRVLPAGRGLSLHGVRLGDVCQLDRCGARLRHAKGSLRAWKCILLGE